MYRFSMWCMLINIIVCLNHFSYLVQVMDFDHREKGKTGSGRVSETQLQIARRDRLFKLAMETSDVSKVMFVVSSTIM